MSIHQKFEELEKLLEEDLQHELDVKNSPAQQAVVACLESAIWGVRHAKWDYEISLK